MTFDRPRINALRAREPTGRPPFRSAVVVRADAVPDPMHRLLVHADAMTPTLAAFHASPIDLDVLMQEHSDSAVTRVVLLRRRSDRLPVAFGAIAVDLERLPVAMRAPVIGGLAPFGRLLAEHGVSFSCRPHTFFETAAEGPLVASLPVEAGARLWGRHNRLFDRDGRPLADVVEVLHLP